MNLKKIAIITGTIILCIIIAAVVYYHKKNAALAQNAISTISVRVQNPLQRAIAQTASATGSLVANKSVIITPRASGYIKKIFFQEGDTVKANDVLFQLDDQTEKDALASTTANEKLSALQFQRDTILLKKGFITQDTYYTAKVTLKQNQAALQTAQTNLAHRTITAPFDGMIGALPISLGSYVNPGDTLTTLVDNKNLRAEYALPVKDLNHLQLNQTVIVEDAMKKNKIQATVSYIAPAVDATTQTIAVHARIYNSTGLFKPGEYVTVTQQLGTQKNQLLVPDQSVLVSINGYYVFVVKNNKAIKTSVKIGKRIDGNVVITNGLQPTDQIIVSGENEVKDQQNVLVSK